MRRTREAVDNWEGRGVMLELFFDGAWDGAAATTFGWSGDGFRWGCEIRGYLGGLVVLEWDGFGGENVVFGIFSN